MEYPRITIVTPSFNQGQYLEETILSITGQQYPNLEFIIIDGGSTDNSTEVIRRHEQSVDYWVSEKDKGQTDAIIKGFSRATGDILTWINSDDIVAPGALHEIARLFGKPGTMAVCGPLTIFDSKKSWSFPAAYHPDESLLSVIGRDSFNQPGTYFHRDAVKAMGWPDERLRYVMDKEWFVRFLLLFGVGAIAVTDKNLAFHRYHDQSKTVAETGQFMTEYAAIIHGFARALRLEKVMQLLEEKYEVKKHNYTVQLPLDNMQPLMVEQMAFVLLVNRFFRVYRKEEFLFGKKLLSWLPVERMDLDERTLKNTAALRKAVAYPGWFFFRLARKLSGGNSARKQNR